MTISEGGSACGTEIAPSMYVPVPWAVEWSSDCKRATDAFVSMPASAGSASVMLVYGCGIVPDARIAMVVSGWPRVPAATLARIVVIKITASIAFFVIFMAVFTSP
nr:hypothetical protein [Candidatus Sigynarchaeum springense]